MNAFAKLALVIFFAMSTANPALAAEIYVDDNCSLRDAIGAANRDTTAKGCRAGDGVDMIILTSDIQLESALPLINSEIVVEGNGHAIVGSGNTHIFGIGKNGHLTINAARINNGNTAWGGAFGNFGQLVISNSVVSENAASEGGAIGNEGELTVVNSIFTNNAAETRGGAIQSLGGQVTVANSAFIANTAVDGGGAIHVLLGDFDVSTSVFYGNAAFSSWERGGGAIFHDDGVLNVLESVFINNTVNHQGGAVYVNDGSAIIKSSSFSNNFAKDSGGAIHNDEGPVLIVGNTFAYNESETDGGALWDYYGDQTHIVNSTFLGNKAAENGGAIAKARRTGVIAHVTMVGNSANQGGGLFKSAEYLNDLSLYNSIIAGSVRGGDCFGRLDENVGNHIEDGSCFAEYSGDPMLDELFEPENGSPAFFLPLDGSPVIDVGNRRYCEDTDQLGTKRIQGDGCDIGSVEIPQEGLTAMRSTADIISAINEGVDISLSINFEVLPPPILREILTIVEETLSGQ